MNEQRDRAQLLREFNEKNYRGEWDNHLLAFRMHQKRIAVIRTRGIIMGIVLVVATLLALFL